MALITKSLNLLVGIPLAALILFEEWMGATVTIFQSM